MTTAEEKRALRAEMRRRRREVSADERKRVSADICGSLLSDAEISSRLAAEGASVAVYMASPYEIDLSSFIRTMHERGVRVVAPRWNGDTYELAQVKGLDEDSLRKGPMGILESVDPPQKGLQESPCAWIVPGLAFTPDGKRLGYGGGWYDRMLADASPDTFLVGVAYPFQIVVDIPHEPHDILLDKVFAADVGDVRLASGIGHGEIWYNTH